MALMAAIAGAIVLFALRPGAAKSVSMNADLEVYKDQLTALEDDIDTGRVEETEAQSARLEISRRLLTVQNATDIGSKTVAEGSPNSMRAVAVATIGTLWFVLTAYIMNGNPDMPGVPFADQNATNPSVETVTQLLARVESHLMTSPEDGRGWDLVAPIYLRMNRFGDAARAFANAGRHSRPQRQSVCRPRRSIGRFEWRRNCPGRAKRSRPGARTGSLIAAPRVSC